MDGFRARLLAGVFILISLIQFVPGVPAVSPGALAASNPIQTENSQTGTTNWKLDFDNLGNPLLAQNHEIEGYASLTSVNAGGQISFMVNLSTSSKYTMDIYRVGYYGGKGGRLMQSVGTLNGSLQATCARTTTTTNFGLTECAWPAAYTLTVPSTWTTGNYLVKLQRSDTKKETYITFVVRNDNTPADVVMSMDVTTWQAYNFWGGAGNGNVGYSLYGQFYDNAANNYNNIGNTRAYAVSFNRPYAVQGETDGAGQLFIWDFPMVTWLEKQGYNVTYITDVDLETTPGILNGRKAFINTGHDEYYSANMRSTIQNAINGGIDMGFFSANDIYYQIRFAADGNNQSNRRIICYKDQTLDPTTIRWRDLSPAQPENSVIGVMQNGVANSRAWRVYDSTSWIFAGTGLVNYTSGTPITSGTGQNAIAGLVGYEFDERAKNDSGLSTWASAEPANIQQVAHSAVPAADNGVAAFSDSTLYTASSAAIIFAAGTIQWSWGLDNGYDSGACDCNQGFANAKSQQITANILNKFIGTPMPAASLSPTTLTFGSQQTGTTSAPQTVTLTNSGTAPLTISSIGLSGTNATDFAQTNTCPVSPNTLASGANCTIGVSFSPAVTGGRTATLSITDNATGSPHTVAISGTGTTPAPIASLSPSSVAFGNQNVGTTSAAQTVTLTNTGSTAMTITAIGFTGNNPGDFAQTSGCPISPSTLAAGANCAINVTFSPAGIGTRSASLSVTDNAAGSPHTVTVSGTGLAPSVSLNPTSLSFGNQQVTTTSPAQNVTLTNGGNAPLTISGISFTGANAADFAQTSSCPASTSTLAAGSSCTISVTFSPGDVGTRSASLAIADNASGSPQSVSVTGSGTSAPTPAVSLSPSTVAFTGQLVGTTSSAQTVTLTNSGTAALTISSIALTGTNASDFAQSSTCPISPSTLAGGASCTITVTFTPTAAGTRSASVAITDNAGGSPHSVALSGTGIAQTVTTTVAPTSLSFGNQGVGTASTAQAVTLSNTGNGTLTISSIGFSGSNPGDFAQTNNCGTSLAPSGNCTINVTFTPATTGSRSANLSIADNSTTNPDTVPLSGSGVFGAGQYLIDGFESGNLGVWSVTSFGAPAGAAGVETTNVNSGSNAAALTNSASGQLIGIVAGLGGPQTQSYTRFCFDVQTLAGSATLASGRNSAGSTVWQVIYNAGNKSLEIYVWDGSSPTPVQYSIFTPANSVQASSTAHWNCLELQVNETTAGGAQAWLNGNAVGLFNANLSNANPYSSLVLFNNSAVGTVYVDDVAVTNSYNGPVGAAANIAPGTPAVALSATSLSFSSQPIGSTSAAKSVTLTNSGNGTLKITTVALEGANPGDFVKSSDTCAGASVAPGATCSISVSFAPTVSGNRAASIAIADNATNTPQSVSLTGIAVGAGQYLIDGFESGNLGAWTVANGGGAAAVQTSVVNSGSNAAALSDSAAGQYIVIYSDLAGGAQTQTYSRFCFDLHGISSSNAPFAQALGADGTYVWEVDYDQGRQGLDVYFRNGAGTRFDLYSPVNILGADTWYCAEIQLNEATAGSGQVWINGNSIGTVSGDLSTANPYTRLKIWNSVAGTVYLDDVAVTNSYNGPAGASSVTLSPNSLTFGSQPVASTSTAQVATLKNSSPNPVTVSSIGTTGDFSVQSTTCSLTSPLAANSSCTINVVFAPTASGSRSGNLSVANSAYGTPLVVSLLGTAVQAAPSAALSPASLTFSGQPVGTTSSAQTMTLTNNGSAPMNVSSVGITGTNASDFAQTNNCPITPSTLAVGTSCTINVTFAPTASGTRSAAVSLFDDAAGSPQTISLTGSGTVPAVTTSPSSLTYGSFPVGTQSAAQAVTLTNSGAAPLSISGIAIGGTNSSDFSQTNTCPTGSSTLAAGASCAINVTFAPTATGTRSGTLSISDNAAGSPQTVALSGMAVGAGQYLIDGFESGSLGAWTISNGGGTASVQTAVPNSGSDAAALTNTAAGQLVGISSDLAGGPQALTYTRFCFNLHNVGITTPLAQALAVSSTGTSYAWEADYDAGRNGLDIYFHDGSGARIDFYSNQNLVTADTWYCLEVQIDQASTGGANIWLNGTQIGSVSNNLSSTNRYSRLMLWNQAAAASVTETAYFDDVAVTNSYNGPVGSGSVALPVPAASLNPTSLTFGNQPLSTASPSQTVTLTNSGTAALTISSISFSGSNPGDFAQTSTCPVGSGTLGVGANCTISVTFMPTAGGGRSASLLVTDNAPGSPHTVNLSGTGTTPGASLSVSSLAFNSQQTGVPSASQPVTLTNTGNVALTISSIGFSGANPGDFSQTNTCGALPASVAAGSSCTISVVFVPTASGARSANLVIADNAPNNPQTVALSGSGTPTGQYLVDGFESGGLVAWSPTGSGSMTIQSTTVNSGTYAAALTNTASGQFAGIYADLAGGSQITSYSRFCFNLHGIGGTIVLAQGRDANGANRWEVDYDQAHAGLDTYFWNGAGTRFSLTTSSNVVKLDNWYCAQVLANETTSGQGQVWLNGLSLGSVTGDLSASTPYSRLYLWNNAAVGTVNVDDVIVTNNFSAPVGSAAAPSNLAAKLNGAGTSQSVGLTWTDNSTNETGFVIQRSTDNVNFTQIASVAAGSTSYTDSTVGRTTTYYYRVQATGASSTYSNVVSIVTK